MPHSLSLSIATYRGKTAWPSEVLPGRALASDRVQNDQDSWFRYSSALTHLLALDAKVKANHVLIPYCSIYTCCHGLTRRDVDVGTSRVPLHRSMTPLQRERLVNCDTLLTQKQMTLECNTCHAPIGDQSRFCDVCGSANIAMVGLSGAGVPTSNTASSTLRKEEVIRRGAAYLLDIVPVLLLAILHFLPIVGWILFGVLASAWWLLRDLNGASLGKTIVGSIVRNQYGQPATTGQLVMRNMPLAIPALLEVIPIIGIILGLIAAIIIFPTEALVLSVTGRRLGDRLAGTNVFRKLPNAPA